MVEPFYLHIIWGYPLNIREQTIIVKFVKLNNSLVLNKNSQTALANAGYYSILLCSMNLTVAKFEDEITVWV